MELGLFVVATAAALALLVPGHFWGDDWALYVRQAEALVHGGVHRVIDDVRFTARNSVMREFTPEGYPWGTSALLAVPIALFGRSIAAMKITMALAFGAAVVAWYAFGRRWLGPLAAAGGAGLLVLSLPLVSWTNLIASDIPYLAAVGSTALVFTRVGHATSSMRSAAALGAAAAGCFAFRQEGMVVLLAVVVGVALQQLAAAAPIARQHRRRTATDVLRSAAIIGITFAAITVAVQLVLPSQFLPRYSTAGPGRIRPNLSFFARSVGSQFGVYDPVDRRVEAFGSAAIGWLLVLLLVVTITAGAARILRRHRPTDVVALLIAGGHLYGALTFPFPDTRYMFVPFAVGCLIAADGAAVVARTILDRLGQRGGFARHHAAVPVVAAVTIGLLVLNEVAPYVTAARGAATARRIDRPAFSPYEPEPQEMFREVRAATAPDDVIAFAAARAITLFTDRRAVQVRGDDPIPEVAGWVVVELVDGAVTPAASGFVEVWRNDRYVLLRRSGTF